MDEFGDDMREAQPVADPIDTNKTEDTVITTTRTDRTFVWCTVTVNLFLTNSSNKSLCYQLSQRRLASSIKKSRAPVGRLRQPASAR